MKATELTILEQNKQLEEIFECSPYAIFIHDYEKILNVNKAFLELYGYTNKEEVIEKAPFSTLVMAEDIEVMRGASESAKEGGGAAWSQISGSLKRTRVFFMGKFISPSLSLVRKCTIKSILPT